MSAIAFDKEMYNRVSQVKVLPPLVNSRRMLEIIHAQIDTAEELESIIGYDCSLAANLLMNANTSCYGQRGKVDTIPGAIGLLGLDRVKWVCLFSLMLDRVASGGAMGEVFREVLWKRSFAASKIAVEMAGKRPWIKVEEAFLLALVYDIGWVVMAECFGEQFEAIFQTAAKMKAPCWWVEVRYGLSHAEMGWYLASQRGLPETFKAVAAFHHAPEKSVAYQAEATLICLVDTLAQSREHPEAFDAKLTRSRCGRLFISEEEWGGYHQSMERIWSEADQMWKLLR
ncbi:MAG: HDOD domain-containing protein [Syntrophobacteraceae bacterium]